MSYQQPSIEFLGVMIQEPVTTLTDLFVSAICFYAFYSLTKVGPKKRSIQFFRYYFLSMGLATLIGGIIGHGFLYLFSFSWKLPGWLISMISVSFLERASIEYAKDYISKSMGRFFSVLNVVELLTFVVITFSTLDFLFVEIHSAYGLLIVVTGFNGWVYLKSRDRASRTILFAVLISSFSALVYINQWGISPWFNHYDISHCIMCVSAWYFYRGARKIASAK